VVEDLHWIDSETQALLDRLVEALPATRILLLVNYRPEYSHGWSNRRSYTQVRIEPLATASAEDLLRSLLGADATLAPLQHQLIEHTRGNPFFLEECVRSLAESGALLGERGAYRLSQDQPDLRVPATVQAILSARIDRLESDEKRVLQTAAVIGKDVPFALLSATSDLEEDALEAVVSRLQAAELIYLLSLFPEREFTFTHALTHEVAYGGLLQDRRREIHGLIVATIERLFPDRLAEHVERLARHATGAEDWAKATTYAQQAGRRAMARSAIREAVGYLEQAVEAVDRLPAWREHQERAIDLRLELRASLRMYGDDTRGLQRLWEAEALAEAIGDRRRLAWTDAHLAATIWMSGNFDHAIEVASRAASIADDLGDSRVRNQAYSSIGLPLWGLGRYREAAEHFRRHSASSLKSSSP
jgi:predicted ATPase